MRFVALSLFLGVASAAVLVVPAGGQYGPSCPCPPPPSAPCCVCQPVRHTVEIGIYDNYFGPDTVTVGAGTVVRWINYGQHRHTSTATAGPWDSGELGHGESYALTFTSPGVASYYCRVHPREMRATLVVR